MEYLAEACGNTFAVLLDENGNAQTRLDEIRRAGRWSFDSALVLRPTSDASVAMSVHERDGSVSAMCGNGVRALGAVLDDLGLPRSVKVPSGILAVECNLRGDYQAPMRPAVWRGQIRRPTLPVFDLYEVEGEPHAVAIVPDADQVPLLSWGPHFVPTANCTVVSRVSPGLIRARTFERGINRETPSCGTGACAAATAVMHRAGFSRGTFRVSMSGHILTVMLMPDALVLEGLVNIIRRKP